MGDLSSNQRLIGQRFGHFYFGSDATKNTEEAFLAGRIFIPTADFSNNNSNNSNGNNNKYTSRAKQGDYHRDMIEREDAFLQMRACVCVSVSECVLAQECVNASLQIKMRSEEQKEGKEEEKEEGDGSRRREWECNTQRGKEKKKRDDS